MVSESAKIFIRLSLTSHKPLPFFISPLFSATYEEVSAHDYAQTEGTELNGAAPILMKLKITRDVQFDGLVDIGEEST